MKTISAFTTFLLLAFASLCLFASTDGDSGLGLKIMDPKMDAGMATTGFKTVDEAIESGAAPVHLNVQQLVDVFDYLIACEVSRSDLFRRFPGFLIQNSSKALLCLKVHFLQRHEIQSTYGS